MGLFGGQKVSVGLDIGNAWIKIVSATIGSSGRPQVTKTICVKNTGDPREIVKRTFAESKLNPSVVVASMDGQDTEMMVQEFIVKTAKEAERLAEVKMHEFNLNEFVINYSLLRGPVQGADGSPVYPVLYVSADKGKVAEFQSLLRASGINLSSLVMDIDLLAAINALDLDQIAVGSTCLIEGGATTTNISVLKDGTLRFTNTVKDDGGTLFTSRLAQELSISIEAAEELKLKNGIDTGSRSSSSGENGSVLELDIDIPSDAPSSSGNDEFKYLNAFKTEIERYLDKLILVIKNYQDNNAELVREIVLTGGIACIKNITGFMKNYFIANNLKINSVTLADSPLLASLNCPDEQRQTFTVALGLALRGLAE